MEEKFEIEVLPSPPAQETAYFTNIFDYIKNNFSSKKNTGIWCYSPWIAENQKIVELANSLGFHAIELHSSNNSNCPMTEEQKRVSDIILTTGMVPIEYDFILVNKAYERGYNIRDQRFNQLIINSINKEEREQVARMTHPYFRALKTYIPEIPNEYLNCWLAVEKCRELAEKMAVPENNYGKPITWNKLKDLLPMAGYSVQGKKKRIAGRLQQCYFISGIWKDVEAENVDFLTLVETKMNTGVAS